jgi:phage protein D
MIDMYPPAQYYQLAQAEAQPEAHEVTEVNISKYLPPNAVSATIIVTVTPPTGAVMIYTPGYEGSPVLFKGPKTVDEIRVSGPVVYVELLAGATGYQIRYLNWRAP